MATNTEFLPGGEVPEPGTFYVLLSETLWIVGRWHGETWQLQGVYSSKGLAEQHARKGWFIGPVDINTPLPEPEMDWPDLELVEADGLAVDHE